MNYTSNTEKGIIDYLTGSKEATVDLLHKELGLSKSIIHRYIKKLVENNVVNKYGTPPRVYYTLAPMQVNSTSPEYLTSKTVKTIEDNFLYTDAKGSMNYGMAGFNLWLQSTSQSHQTGIYDEYASAITELDSHKTSRGYIDATDRIADILDEVCLSQVFYSDFYSTLKFGKTKLGKLVLHAKESQSRKLTKVIANMVKEHILSIVEELNIEAVAFLPHSIPRSTQFLKEFEDILNLTLPSIKLDKAYPGEIIVAQKGLSKLKDRVENARETIFIRDTTKKYDRVLLIDDAVGSGATLNETARKMLNNNVANEVYGYGVVGSLKGFDVLPRV